MSTPDTPPPIRIALIGAGLFARGAHVPALLSLPEHFEIVAVASRTLASAQALAGLLPRPVPCCDDIPATLARPDINAVDIILPITLIPEMVEMALAAGKHVLSEKPVAPDVRTGRHLLAITANYPDQVYMVSENYRREPGFLRTAELIAAGVIGQPRLVNWTFCRLIGPDSPYYHTAWRKDSRYQGGYILDVGVHHMAVLRLILGEIAAVQAATAHVNPVHNTIDTINATLRFERGVSGQYAATYACDSSGPQGLIIIGDAGTLWLDDTHINIQTGQKLTREALPPRNGIEQVLRDFAAAIRTGKSDLNSPQTALQDVAVIEAMLRSAEQGGWVTPERVT